MNFIECEEVTTGEEYLKTCLDLISPHKSSSNYCCLHLAVYNQLGILWSHRASHDKAFELYKSAEELYNETKNNGCSSPLNFNEIWRNPKSISSIAERESFFENLHTLTLYYLAQVYNHLGKTELAAKYCHTTLARQMETKQYGALEWSLNCATLSQYYVTQDKFSFARYCLACAELVNKEVDFEQMEVSDANEKERVQEKMYKSKADVYRCWSKYALNLLKMSHSAKMSAGDDKNGVKICYDEQECKELRFGALEVTVYEEQISDKLAVDYAAAKAIFTFSLKCLQTAKEFYKLDGYVSDYVEITQDISQFYKYLAFFDDDFDNRCKMHKRRADMLNGILIELNPQHFLQICRQLTFEIAECYSEMVALKKVILEENPKKLSVNAVKKINFLLLKSMKFYNGFVDSYKHEDKFPEKFEDDDVRGILLCYFCMARLNSKYYTNDKQTKIDFLLKEKECYEFIVNYCDKHEDMPNVFEEETVMSREMLGLFHAKMNNVMNNM